MNKKTLISILSVIAGLLIWQAVAMAVGSEMLIASPVRVAVRFFTIWGESGFIKSVLLSWLRITAGFLAAFVLGGISGFVAGKSRIAEAVLWPYVSVVKAVPVASFIIIFLLWTDYSLLTVFISFLIAFPVVYSNVLQGIKSTDVKMLEMSEVFRISPVKKFIFIFLPSVRPYLTSSAKIAVGMAWKAGVSAEIIGLVGNSIGNLLYMAKVYFQNADMVCLTIVIILASIATEKLFVFLLDRAFGGLEKL